MEIEIDKEFIEEFKNKRHLQHTEFIYKQDFNEVRTLLPYTHCFVIIENKNNSEDRKFIHGTIFKNKDNTHQLYFANVGLINPADFDVVGAFIAKDEIINDAAGKYNDFNMSIITF